MKSFFRIIIKFIVAFVVGIWDFIFFFFGFTYEKQASKLNLDDMDDFIKGAVNEKLRISFIEPIKSLKKEHRC